jgi:hypothetical protein
VPVLRQEGRGDRGIHPAGHRDYDPHVRPSPAHP